MSVAPVIPFGRVLEPFAARGREQLERDAGDAAALLSPAARATSEAALLQLLSWLALPVLDQELALREGLEGRFPWQAASRSSLAYEQYADELANGGMAGVLREYPVLEEVLTSWTRGWARSHALLARRLADDWPLLRERFALHGARCNVEAITAYRSDPHHGGATVTFVQLQNGPLLVYKPRALAMEEGFGELLQWANARRFPWPFRSVAVLDRNHYGWMEHVPAAPCASSAEVEAFYARVGGLLCLLTLLQATDIHHENLIASGDQPVIVDLETLFHPRLHPELQDALGPGARRRTRGDDFATSLAETGFLPSDGALDFSALGATAAIETPFAVTDYSNVAASVRKRFRVPLRQNVPALHGRPMPAADHQESIVAGFRAMFLLVLRHRADFVANLQRFAGRAGRFVARSSNVYGLLLQQSLLPPFLRDGARRAELFACLSRGTDARVASIVAEEQSALERVDVPYLATRCGQPSQCWPSPLAQVLARIEAAAAADLPAHLDVLRCELAKLESESRPQPLEAAAG